jgi:hypothetical protein
VTIFFEAFLACVVVNIPMSKVSDWLSKSAAVGWRLSAESRLS